MYLCAISRIVFVFIFIGADGYNVPNFVCDIYFNGQVPCFGGVLAIDGRTGQRLWTQWAPHEVFAITCQGDLNKDGIFDCVAGGRAGVSSGFTVWKFQDFSITQIFREINFVDSRSAKTAIFAIVRAVNFVDLLNSSLQKLPKSIKSKI